MYNKSSTLANRSIDVKSSNTSGEDTAPLVANITNNFDAFEAIDVEFDVTDLDGSQLSWDLIDTEPTATPDLAFDKQQPLLNLVSTLSAAQHHNFPTPPYSPISALSSMPLYHLRAFARNPVTVSGGANTTSILMMRMLTSYPMMLRDPTSPPPFIHPLFLTSEERPLESLNTCVSLMQMLGSGIKGSKKLVWKNIRLECERLQVQWTNLDAWELLSSMQALLLYMLLRLQDGEKEYNDFDVLLLSTMWVVGCAMNDRIVNFNCSSPLGLSFGTTYSDWVFEESRRRLGLVFRIIGMLFSTDPAAACTLLDGFLISPLPSHKRLWEARDKTEWTTRRGLDAEHEVTFGIRPGSQMGKLETGHSVPIGHYASSWEQPTESESNTHWQEWSLGMDSLGALIMLAASLPIHV
ncbi:hypothetical protein DE146DRAFT_753280 [Phaeosphaeria sp. MPI-PUGE-AT-0046c]|nr:hypothetical protein DE146DRAFT_753280 [Phaeosphaeria sp. MPI-PUGE-AT-0046c]